MFFLILSSLVKSSDYSYSSTTEGYNSMSPSQSPARLTIAKNLGLMMVNWPDAVLKITISGVLNTPVELTKDAGYSLFTFKDDAIVEITFTQPTSYYICQCPQYNSLRGAIQYFSNHRNIKISQGSKSKDIYFSFYGPHSILGSIEHSSAVTLHYSTGPDEKHQTTDVSNIDLSEVKFTSSLIRSYMTSTISFENLAFTTSQTSDGTVPTFIALDWDSVSGNQNNFLSNSAYVGVINKDPKIIDMDDIKYVINFDYNVKLAASFAYQIDDGNMVQLTASKKHSETKPFKVNIYVKYNQCSSYTKIKSFQSKIPSTNTITISDDDIPDICNQQPEYFKVCFTNLNQLQDYRFGYKTSIDLNDQIKDLTEEPIVNQNQFELTLYIKSGPSGCSNVELKKYQSSKTFECISLDETIIPDSCKLRYYIKVRNELDSDTYKVYALNLKNEYEEVTDLFEAINDSPFTIKLYLTSSKCPDYLNFANATSETNSTIIDSITLDFVPKKCRTDLKTYYATIKNDLTSKIPLGELYIIDSTGKKVIIEKNKQYTYKEEETEPFKIDVYVKSLYCQGQKIDTVIGQENPSLVTSYNDLNVPEVCLSFSICFDSQLPTGYSLGYKDLSNLSNPIVPFGGSTSIGHNILFEAELYLMSSPNCQNNLLLTKYTAERNLKCNIISLNDIPTNCQSSGDYHYVCFYRNNIPADYIFGYTTNIESNSQITQLKNDPIFNENEFEMTLYLMKGPSGCSNIELKKYKSSKNFECISLDESFIPEDCNTKYYVKMRNNLNSSLIKLYALTLENQYVEIIDDFVYSKESPFTIYFYITSPLCPNYTNIGYGNSVTDPTTVGSVDKSKIPESCLPAEVTNYYMKIKNIITSSNYSLYIKDRNNKFVQVDDYYEDESTSLYTYEAYIKSDKCQNYTLISKQSSTTNISEIYDVHDIHVPNQCINDGQTLSVTIFNNFSSTDFKLFAKNQKDQLIEVLPNTPYVESSTSQFIVHMYITSPFCTQHTEINEVAYPEFSESNYAGVVDAFIPSKCRGSMEFSMCYNLSPLSSKYKISYLIDYGYKSEMKEAVMGVNVESSNNPFSVTAYLNESYSCNETINLGTFTATLSSDCKTVTSDMLPFECTIGDDSHKVKNKSVPVPLIAGVSAGAVIIIAIIVTVILVVKKRKKDISLNENEIPDNTSQF